MPSFMHTMRGNKTLGTNAVLASVQLPSGSYIVAAKVTLFAKFPDDGAGCLVRLVVGQRENSTARTLTKAGQLVQLVVGENLATGSDAQLILTMDPSERALVHDVVMIAQSVDSLAITEAEGDPVEDEVG